ncbi:hypothetical protein HYH03_006590 [Edaphochlamys debaryana]|uniref:Ankyrin repeat domain-containing protein n=1 Tax=Edaphochlamys debaryana TaxID=47281 RepID=A0A835YAH1_9CHLO|nr:hypothetical protein HYH03_006590 [Edaphochlamys debaryana]|eukprot:KAG2495320.1 hypothetical protein HYH03_006590 [Edaphochlamys debaryana]
MSSNEVATGLRLANKATARTLRGAEHTTIHLSEPVPCAAFQHHWTAPAAFRTMGRKQREKLLCLTAASGDLTNLQVALQATGLVLPGGKAAPLLCAAGRAGRLEVCKWLAARHRVDRDCWVSLFQAAAKGGQPAVCQWAVQQKEIGPGAGYPIEPDELERAAMQAAGKGHAQLVWWLLPAVLSPDPRGLRPAPGLHCRLLAAAAKGCDLDTVQRLCSLDGGPEAWAAAEGGGSGGRGVWGGGQAPAVQWDRVLGKAVRGHTGEWRAVTAFLLLRGARFGAPMGASAGLQGLYAHAARVPGPGALERLTWLASLGAGAPGQAALQAAVAAGNLAAVQWILRQGMPYLQLGDIQESVRRAAAGGRLALLRALHGGGCPLEPAGPLMQAAIEGGHLELARWLLAAFPRACFDKALASNDTWYEAYGAGNVELMAWLHEQGCPLDVSNWRWAAQCGCEAALEQLRDWGCRKTSSGDAYEAAANEGDLRTLEALRRLHAPFGPASGYMLSRAVKEAPLPCLKWLVEAGAPVDWSRLEGQGYWRMSGDSDEVEHWIAVESLKAARQAAAAEAAQRGKGKGAKGAKAPAPAKPAAKNPRKVAAKPTAKPTAKATAKAAAEASVAAAAKALVQRAVKAAARPPPAATRPRARAAAQARAQAPGGVAKRAPQGRGRGGAAGAKRKKPKRVKVWTVGRALDPPPGPDGRRPVTIAAMYASRNSWRNKL